MLLCKSKKRVCASFWCRVEPVKEGIGTKRPLVRVSLPTVSGRAQRHCCRCSREQMLTKSQNVWHPVSGTEEQQQQQQQRDQPEVRPGNVTGYRQMLGGNLHVVVFFVDGHWSNPPRARVLLPRKSSGRLPRQGDGGPGCARSRHGHLRVF